MLQTPAGEFIRFTYMYIYVYIGVEIFSIDFSFVIRKVGGREMTEGIRKGDKSSSYLDRLIDFPFVPPVSIINLVPSDKSSRSLRLSTFLIRFAGRGGDDSPILDRFSESARLFSSISLPSSDIGNDKIEISRFSYLISGINKEDESKLVWIYNNFIVSSTNVWWNF